MRTTLKILALGLLASGCTINIGGSSESKETTTTENAQGDVNVELENGEASGSIQVRSTEDGGSVTLGSGSDTLTVSGEDKDGKKTVNVGGLKIEVESDDDE